MLSCRKNESPAEMYETDKLIFVQMQKTASTHIASLLAQIFNAGPANNGLGKHWPASPKQLSSGKIIASSIRNPWDWYVSLWTFGAEGKGGLRNRLCNHAEHDYDKNNSGTSSSDCNPFRMNSHGECNRSTSAEWQLVYSDKTSISLFRKWLCMLLDPVNSYQVGEEYGQRGVAENCGFMTHRYLRLCCLTKPRFDNNKKLENHSALRGFDDASCYIDYFIRQEFLNQDFCELVGKIRPISDKENCFIHNARPTNSSIRAHKLSHYYNEACTKLVLNRDRLIVDKFGYLFGNSND